tara:strand:- start:4322 stop:7765 length:3444 start_codon:yes stop_codon:yes gene_type:complete
MTTYNSNDFFNASDKPQYWKDWARNEPGSLANVIDTSIGQLPSNFLSSLDEAETEDKEVIKFIYSQFAPIYLEATITVIGDEIGATEGSLTLQTTRALIVNDNLDGTELKKLFCNWIVQARRAAYLSYGEVGSLVTYSSGWQGTMPGSGGNLGQIASRAKKSFKDKIDELVDASLDANGVADPSTGEEGIEALAALEKDNNRAVDAAAVAAPLIRGTNVEEETYKEDDLRNFLQCVLLRDFVNEIASKQGGNAAVSDGDFGWSILNVDQGTAKSKGPWIKPYNGRIIPLTMAEPTEFLNKCNFPKNFQHLFRRKSYHKKSELTPSFFYVKPKIKEVQGVTTIEGTEEVPLKLTQDDGKVKFKGLTITFDGTNPSTARRDIKVTLKLGLANLGSLTANVAQQDNEINFELYKLITIPYGVKAPSTIAGGIVRNQYSPDYNRIRLKLKCQYKADFSASSRLTKEAGGAKHTYDMDQCFDLAIEGHTITRSDIENESELVINYRGYFETLLSHPFMDSLATPAEVQSRFYADYNLTEAAKKCSEDTLKKIIKINQMADRTTAKTAGWQKFMNQIPKENTGWVKYTVPKQFLRSFALVDSLSFLRSTDKACIFRVGRSLTATQINDQISNLTDVQDEMTDEKIEDDLSKDGLKKVSESSWTTLGDIMNVALSGLYDPNDKSKLASQFKHLNLKFAVAPIQIRNPLDNDTILKFNPLDLPIDIFFFHQWFHSNIVNKDLTYYPILTMMRDLIERLVNNLLYEVCFPNSLPDEAPPSLRTGFFQDSSNLNLLDYPLDGFNYYHDVDRALDESPKKQRLFEYDSEAKPEEINNYCLIYMQNRGTFVRSGVSDSLYTSPFVPSFNHGAAFTEIGSEDNDGLMSDVAFSKASTPGLKEARFFSSPVGGLNILSNVYNLNFNLKNIAANMSIYPGQIIKFKLHDFDKYNNDYRKPGSLSAIMGFGGYYTVKKTEIQINAETGESFSIKYESLWSGNGNNIDFRRQRTDGVIIERSDQCQTYFDTAKTRYYSAGGTEEVDEDFQVIETATEAGARYFLHGSVGGDDGLQEVQDIEAALQQKADEISGAWFDNDGGKLLNNYNIGDSRRDESDQTTKGLIATITSIPSNRASVQVLIEESDSGITGEYIITQGATVLVR